MTDLIRIVLDPTILAGKPVIPGTRIAVDFIIGLLADGWNEKHILQNYPGLSHEDVAACLAYARDVLRSEKVYPSAASGCCGANPNYVMPCCLKLRNGAARKIFVSKKAHLTARMRTYWRRQVWMDFLNGRNALHVRRLRGILGIDEVIVGDLMLCQVLQGLEGERAARDVEALLRRFQIVSMVGHVSSRTLAFVHQVEPARVSRIMCMSLSSGCCSALI